MSDDLKALLSTARELASRLEAQPAAAAPAAPPSTAAPADHSALAAAIATAIAAQQAAQAAQQRPAPAAPSAPTGHSLPTVQGITDLWSLQPHDIKALGARGVRKILDEMTSAGREAAGLPPRKNPGKGR